MITRQLPDITTEQQERLWESIPYDIRNELRGLYLKAWNGHKLGKMAIYSNLFGGHNLLSNRETSNGKDEAFIVWRKDVQATYAYNEMILKHDPTHKGALLLKEYLLRTFGDKCLASESKGEETTSSDNDNDNIPCESQQPEPKFKIGDQVIVYVDNVTLVARITDVHAIYPQFCYKIDHHIYKYRWFSEAMLEPFTELPSEMKTLEESLPEAAQIINDNFDDLLMNETNPTVDNDGEIPMEVYDLLKGHEGETFYNPLLGSVTVTLNDDVRLIHISQGNIVVDLGPNGEDIDGNMALFPSKDARDWDKWYNSKKPNYTLQVKLNPYEDDKLLLSKAEEFEVAVDSLDEAEDISDIIRKAVSVRCEQKRNEKML